MALDFPNIDPVAIHLGPIAIHWYALAYLSGFLIGWWVAKYICRMDQNRFRPHEADIDDFMSWAILSILLGGRLGYILFYNLPHYIEYPLDVLKLWQGGMAFHGALIGVISVCIFYSWKKKVSLLRLADLFAVAAPVGFFFGRIANFINGELFGRPTDVAWGVIFPNGGPEPRHASQLYEAALEGAFMFAVLFALSHVSKIRNTPGLLSAGFLFIYGGSRFIIEFYRQPDPQLGLFFDTFSMGQLLCLPMILGGFVMIAVARIAKRKNHVLQPQ